VKELKVERLKLKQHFDGTRVNPEKSGSITQICSENLTPEDFCYGVLKGMSTELYQMYMTIQKGIGIKIRRMIGSGNGLRKNPVLCEIIEDMFKAEFVLAECEEEAATGAAMSSSMYNYSNSTR
jgi:Sugar (pentulose and hexulose) kinases